MIAPSIQVAWSCEAISAAVEWSVRHLPDFRLPDKAIDLLDTACAQARFLTFSGGASPQCVDRAFIKQRELIAGQAEILKKLAQMDAKLLKHDDALRMTHAGRIKCIEIDPPYNTGNNDFIYNDVFLNKDHLRPSHSAIFNGALWNQTMMFFTTKAPRHKDTKGRKQNADLNADLILW